MARTYESNFAVVDAIRKSGRKLNEQAMPEMVEWCRRIGIKPVDLWAFKPIHIAGTKGKGSTAAFTSSILQQFIYYKQHPGAREFSKVGLYTSPHLTSVRERIQINGKPLDEDVFARYFFEVWDRLEAAATEAGQDPKAAQAKPVYFRYLTLMAFHTYISEKVDVAVIECGIGGAYDSTNVIEYPAAAGITTLGIDHVGMLGSTISDIAWHKAGIMKEGSVCYTHVDQPPEAKAVLEKVAREKRTTLKYVQTHAGIQHGDLELGLQGDFQKINATLAVELANKWLSEEGYYANEEFWKRVRVGLQSVQWPGRCEIKHGLGVTWCIDGAHTMESIKLAGEWFASQITANSTSGQATATPAQPKPRFLLFNQQGLRDASSLAVELFNTLSTALNNAHPFTHVIFCTNTTFEDTGYKPDLVSMNTKDSDVQTLKVQRELAETWSKIDPRAKVEVVRTIEGAVRMIQGYANTHQGNSSVDTKEKGIVTLVTGSLHLVGGFLAVLEQLVASQAVAPRSASTNDLTPVPPG
ncbi:hypothetical protein H2200_010533 [Cladophialophora chaetospira]|uniref:Folylpolyglutamate synthase n=1 Tax=Cladophialophora chaetospira TaxID=386627 RepID=A0AA38X1Q0_9EURO|nr:hypothetical protein H2200_010533 [Cladophialophora chaetospira]